MFRRFGNKDKLILEALKQEAAKLDGVASLYNSNLEQDLTQILSAYQILLRVRAPLILTFYTEITRHPELAAVLEFPKRIIQKMLTMLERYQKEGKLKRKKPIHQLAELFGPVMMLMLFEVLYAGEAPLDTEEHIKSFIKSNSP